MYFFIEKKTDRNDRQIKNVRLFQQEAGVELKETSLSKTIANMKMFFKKVYKIIAI